MKMLAAIICAFITAALIGGCGNSNANTPANVTHYDDLKNIIIKPYTPKSPIQLTSPAQVSTLPNITGTAGFSNYSGTAGFRNISTVRKASFNRPIDITTDGTNYLYVADYANHAIRMVDKTTGVTTTLAGSGLAGSLDAVGKAASFNHPTGITTSGNFIYVVDSGNHIIRQIDKTSGKVQIIAGIAATAGSIDDDTGTLAKFNTPIGITTDDNSLFVTDSGNHTIRRIALSAPYAVTTVAGSPGLVGSDNGIQGAARFNLPARITTDGPNLYVTDFNNRTIRQIDLATGSVSTLAGMAGTQPGTDDADAIGTTARFNQPNGITTDGTNLYVTDSYNNTIRKIVIASKEVTKIAGITYGKPGSPGNVDSASGTPSFSAPIGITTDGTSLFVADNLNHTIRVIK